MSTHARTLVLNQDYSPLCTIPWERAVILVHFDKKAEIIKTSDKFKVRSVSSELAAPSVIRLNSYIRNNVIKIRFHKGSVYMRDKGRCQYCRNEISIKAATYDHVTPRSRGGKTCWSNIVTCCYTCNQKKNCRTPDEAGMKLLSLPVKPTHLPLAFLGRHSRNIPEDWMEFFAPFIGKLS